MVGITALDYTAPGRGEVGYFSCSRILYYFPYFSILLKFVSIFIILSYTQLPGSRYNFIDYFYFYYYYFAFKIGTLSYSYSYTYI